MPSCRTRFDMTANGVLTLLLHIRYNLQQHFRRDVSGSAAKWLSIRIDEPGGWQIIDLVHAGDLFLLVYINLYRGVPVV